METVTPPLLGTKLLNNMHKHRESPCGTHALYRSVARAHNSISIVDLNFTKGEKDMWMFGCLIIDSKETRATGIRRMFSWLH